MEKNGSWPFPFDPMTSRMHTVATIVFVLLAARYAHAQDGLTKVVTARAAMKQLPVTMTLVATVEPVTRSAIGAEVAGLVVDMPARQGDLIERGGLICKLNDDVLALQVAREQARLDALQSGLDELLNGTRAEELARLKAELGAAAAVAQRWTFELARVKRLQGGDYANEKEYQDALADQLAAENRRLAAQALYDEGVAGPRVEAIAAARSAVAEQLAEVNRLKTNLAKTRIQAPFTGHVVKRHAEVGNWLPVGASVVEMIDLVTVLVRVDAPEQAIPYATVGSPASVYVDALDQSFAGRIKHVVPQADPAAHTFPIEIEVPNPDYALKAGMFARATIIAGPDRQTVAVPKDAVSRQMGASFIAMINPGPNGQLMAVPMPVTVGLDIGDWVAITSGNVPADAQVVVRGNEMITLMMAPAPVEVVNEPAEPATSSSEPSPQTEE